MVALNLFRAVFLCLLVSVASDAVYGDTRTDANPAEAFSIDSAQRQEIQSMLDSLTGSPEIETVIASRAKISEYIFDNF